MSANKELMDKLGECGNKNPPINMDAINGDMDQTINYVKTQKVPNLVPLAALLMYSNYARGLLLTITDTETLDRIIRGASAKMNTLTKGMSASEGSKIYKAIINFT